MYKEERRSRVRREQLTQICCLGPCDFCTGASSKLMEGLGGLEDSLIFYDVQGVSRDDFFSNNLNLLPSLLEVGRGRRQGRDRKASQTHPQWP